MKSKILEFSHIHTYVAFDSFPSNGKYRGCAYGKSEIKNANESIFVWKINLWHKSKDQLNRKYSKHTWKKGEF